VIPHLSWLGTILIELGSCAAKISRSEGYSLQCTSCFAVLNDNFELVQKILSTTGIRIEKQAAVDLSSSTSISESFDSNASPAASGGDSSALPSPASVATPVSEEASQQEEWTNVQRKQLRRKSEMNTVDYTFVLRFDQLYPAYVYTKLASAVELFLDGQK